jgi:hypothetical protein
MKFIANILTDKPFVNTELYNVVNDKDKLIDGIPTLVIGWEYTKKMYENANILNWEIDRNTYWTYGKREKRNRYEENLEKFRELALYRFIKSVKYSYFNILIASNEEKEYVWSLIDTDGTYVYLNNDMVYAFDEQENKVIGFSLRDIDYLKKDRKKVLSKIYSNTNLIEVKDNLSWETKNALRNCSYVIPFLWV